MNESKIELTERLRVEGRWAEAANFKETARADLRTKGMGRQEAVEAAWEAMAEAYPPLSVADAAGQSGRTGGSGHGRRSNPLAGPARSGRLRR